MIAFQTDRVSSDIVMGASLGHDLRTHFSDSVDPIPDTWKFIV